MEKNNQFLAIFLIAFILLVVKLRRKKVNKEILSYDNDEAARLIKNVIGTNSNLTNNANNRAYVNESINIIIDEFYRQGYNNIAQLAYLLATAKHESKFGEWMVEKGGPEYLKSKYYYQTAKGKELGNTQENDHILFAGRGFVQLTGRANYAKYEKILNMPLTENPRLVEDRKVAAFILVHGSMNGTFTQKHKLPTYINSLFSDFFNARRVINGIGRKGSDSYNAALLVQGYTEQFLKELYERVKEEQDRAIKEKLASIMSGWKFSG